MGRIRTIKPEFPQSESMGNVTRDARLCFILLWTVADDAGRTRGNSRMLASTLFPYDTDAPSLIDGWLEELEKEKCIHRYEVGSHKYIEIINWHKQQKIDKPTASRLPSRLTKDADSSTTPHRIVVNGSGNPLRHVADESWLEGKGREGTKEEDQGGESERIVASPAAGLSSSDQDLRAEATDVARAIIEETGLTNWKVREQIVLQAERQLRLTGDRDNPITKDELHSVMGGNWKLYDACVQADRIRFPVTPERFFSDGLWKGSKKWGFKKGMSADGIVI